MVSSATGWQPLLAQVRGVMEEVKNHCQKFNLQAFEQLEKDLSSASPDASQLKARLISIGNGRLTHPALRKIYTILCRQSPEADTVQLADSEGNKYPVPMSLGLGCSDFIHAFLTNGMQESRRKEPVVNLEEYSPDAVQVVHDYMSHGHTGELTPNNLLEVYSCARFLQMADLEDICFTQLVLKGENLWECLAWAALNSEKRLQERCLSFIKTEPLSTFAPHPIWGALTPSVVQFIQRDLKVSLYFLADGSTSVALRDTLHEMDQNVLAVLNIKELSLMPFHLPFISVLSTLETLTISSPISGKDVKLLGKFLQKNTTLKQLFLTGANLDDDGVQILAESLHKNQSLQVLCLAHNHIGDKGAEALAKMIESSNLAVLNLQQNRIGPKGAKALAKKLQKNRRFTCLLLDHNSIGDKGTRSLAKYLNANQKMNVLSLSHNRIGIKGARELAGLLGTNPIYKSICLSGNSLGDEGVILVAEKLKHIDKQVKFDVSGTGLSAAAAKVLAAGLRNIEELNVADNHLGPEGSVSIGEIAAKNPLHTLHLRGNGLGDEGASELASKLHRHAHLTALDLGANAIGDAGALALAKMLKGNTTLRTLCLANNLIGDNGVKGIVAALDQNHDLDVTLLSNAYGEEGRAALSNAHILN